MEQIAYLGGNSIENLEKILSEISPTRVFLVRGKKSYISSGAKEQIERFLLPNIKVIDFFDFQENPKIEDLMNGLELLQNLNPDLIIAIGGGSVLDMAKLIRFCHSYDGDPIGKVFDKKKSLIPLVAIPTTAGTGSEATHFSVIYKDGVKYSLEHGDILPDYAIIYPRFTYNNPKYLTACTGFDALAQSIEAYWNVNATEESDEHALKAIHLLWNDLPIAVNSPTTTARDRISEGAYWAGKAINITKTTAPHAFSYPFTTHYGYPHGHAVALTFPFFWKLNVERQIPLSDKLDKIAYAIKIQKLKILLSSDIDLYIKNIGLRSKHTIDFTRDQIILDNINLQRLSNNPIILTEQDFSTLL